MRNFAFLTLKSKLHKEGYAMAGAGAIVGQGGVEAIPIRCYPKCGVLSQVTFALVLSRDAVVVPKGTAEGLHEIRVLDGEEGDGREP